MVRHTGRTIVGDIDLLDEDGRTLVEITGYHARAVSSVGAAEDLNDCLYEFAWKLRPLGPAAGSSEFLAPVAHVAARTEELAIQLQQRHSGRPAPAELDAEIHRLCQSYLLAALVHLGWRWQEGESVSAELLAQRLSIAARHRRIFERYLGLLEADGVLSRSGDTWTVRRVDAPIDPEALARSLLARFPDALPELMTIRRAGSELAAILQGTTDPLPVIFPEGSAIVEQFYQDAPSTRTSNRLMAEAVSTVLERRPEGRTARILEVGAGTGGATAHILPKLSKDRTDYVWSDPSDVVLANAEQKFFEHPFVRYQRLDIEKAPAEQGFERHSFDLVVAANGLHATADVRQALAHVRALLAPHGLLILRETLRSTWPVNLIFGLTDRWWRFHDTLLRSSGPLLDGPRWQVLLRDMGFVDVCAVADRTSDDRPRQAVLLAREPAASTRRGDDRPPAARRSEQPGAWLLFADRAGLAGEAAAKLTARGHRPVTVFAGPDFRRLGAASFEIRPGSSEDMRRLLGAIRDRGEPAIAGVVHLWSLDAPPPAETSAPSLLAAETAGCHSVIHLLQTLAQDATVGRPRLWLVTRGAQAVESADPVGIAQAPLWGLGRVVMNELPGFRCRLVDLAPVAAEDDAAGLLDELDAADGEEEIARRGAARYAHRLVRTSVEHHVRPLQTPADQAGYRLEIAAPGAPEALVFRAHTRRRPGPGEVEIHVHAAALNFRDVMKTLSIYPTDDDSDTLLGDECAGRIAAVGPGVDHWCEGDRVLAFAAGSFSSHVTIPAVQAVPLPARWGFEEAATIPVAFLTAWYALRHLGRLRPGERVLIQAATGGVGLAAVQVAQLAGAEIFATAGSPEKRDVLRALGIRHVMDSRSLDFADEVHAITKGRGVDLVLNSLAGDAIAKGIACLAPGGRFLEIGRRDIYENSKLGLRALRSNLSFFVIDLAQVRRDDPALVATLLGQIMAHVAEERLHPLPLRTFPMSQAAAALRHMSQARHIGKIVLSLEHDYITPVPIPEDEPLRLKADATYMITGGLGGFGLAVAQWMLQSGARHLVLVGRSGAATETARQAVASLQNAGGEIVVAAADVSDSHDVARVFDMIARQMPPLAGIVHAAMVIADSTVLQQSDEQFRRVLAPKSAGAWHLHDQSARLPLDFFVLFSSITTMLGNPGRVSYSAANCFLDALAHHRRARGLPALVVNWGVIGDVGHVARTPMLAETLHHQGSDALRSAAATGVLGRLLQSDAVQVGVARIDWQKIGRHLDAVSRSPRYADVRFAVASRETGEERISREGILAVPERERLAAVTAELKGQVAKVLRISPVKLESQRPLNALGLDSLMGVELANRIEVSFGIVMPSRKITSGASVASLAGELLELVTGGSRAPADEALPPAAAIAPPTGEDAAPNRHGAPAAPPVAVLETAVPPADSGSGSRPLRARHYLEWLLLRAGVAYLRRGDLQQASRRTRRVARLAKFVLRSEWQWALQNLKLVFGPNLTEAQRRRLATLAFENHLISYMEGLRATDVTIEFRNQERLQDALAAGKGVIACGVHIGSWEPLLSHGMADDVPLVVPYRPAHNPLGDRVFQENRAAYKAEWIPSTNVDASAAALRDGKILGLMTDLNTVTGGTAADFLGVPATCPAGPARLALLLGTPIVPSVSIRSAIGRAVVHFEPAIVPPPNEFSDEQVRQLTRRINAAFEPWILEYAEQYQLAASPLALPARRPGIDPPHERRRSLA